MSEELAGGQAVFMCDKHSFVIAVRGTEVSCWDTPGNRVKGCGSCDRAVADAFELADDYAEAEGDE